MKLVIELLKHRYFLTNYLKLQILAWSVPSIYIVVLDLGDNLYNQLKKALRQDCGFAYSFIERGQIDPKVQFSYGKLALRGKNHADSSLDCSKKRDNHICLDAEPQSGKTVAGLLVIAHFRNLISSGQEELEIQSDFEIQSDAETDITDEEQGNL